jgi:putative phage-type endonuclease
MDIKNIFYINGHDIIDTVIPDENIYYFTDDEIDELYELCLYLIDEIISDDPDIISEQDFDETIVSQIEEIIKMHYIDDIFFTDDSEDELLDIIHHAKEYYFTYIVASTTNNDVINDISDLTEKINRIREKPQPTQRTKEWYEFRHNLITASNAYKAFDSQSLRNQLIYEKCQPISNTNDDDIKEITLVNVNTTLHWGQKYEPVSVMIYEEMFNTKIEDFGCIQHSEYPFLGASPDGINIDLKSDRYGRMLEIKNIVNRVINGIPKKEYWIQMQLQMEVCDLDNCDFLETKFVEYIDFYDFLSDTNDNENLCISKNNKRKGIFIYFHKNDGKPFYVYKPLNITQPDEISLWQEKTLDEYQSEKYNYMFMKTIYWKLEELSCVLVCRNKSWFKNNINILEETWNTIKSERVSGYEHRAPNKRVKKEFVPTQTNNSQGCLLIKQKINVIKI